MHTVITGSHKVSLYFKEHKPKTTILDDNM